MFPCFLETGDQDPSLLFLTIPRPNYFFFFFFFLDPLYFWGPDIIRDQTPGVIKQQKYAALGFRLFVFLSRSR